MDSVASDNGYLLFTWHYELIYNMFLITYLLYLQLHMLVEMVVNTLCY